MAYTVDTPRFWSKVSKLGPDECWPWMAYVGAGGYGRFRFKGSMWLAHRVAYILCRRDIPKGEGHHGTVVMHSCDNPICCNPKHLTTGTQADNIADMKAKGRRKNKSAGEDNGRAILTPNDVQKIRLDRRTCRLIAEEYSVGQTTVRHIQSGKNWAWLAQ